MATHPHLTSILVLDQLGSITRDKVAPASGGVMGPGATSQAHASLLAMGLLLSSDPFSLYWWTDPCKDVGAVGWHGGSCSSISIVTSMELTTSLYTH